MSAETFILSTFFHAIDKIALKQSELSRIV
jgi:hypothetical protein